MEKGYTQRDLHALLGIVEKTIQNHESGKTRPPQSQLERYCRFYGCSYRWLVTGKEEYKQAEERMLPHKDHVAPDSGPGQLKIPDFGAYKIVKLIESEEGQHEGFDQLRMTLHAALDYILREGTQRLITALRLNMEQFSLQVDMEKRIRQLEMKIGILPGERKNRSME